MRWKNVIQPGSYEPMVSSMDIFHTSIGIADIQLPDDRTYDGKDLLPFLLQSDGHPHEYLYWQRGFSKSVRDARWKLSINAESKDSILFDLADDPYETLNLFDSKKPKARALADVHARWSQGLEKPLWPSMIYYQFRDGDELYYFDQ